DNRISLAAHTALRNRRVRSRGRELHEARGRKTHVELLREGTVGIDIGGIGRFRLRSQSAAAGKLSIGLGGPRTLRILLAGSRVEVDEAGVILQCEMRPSLGRALGLAHRSPFNS